MNKTLTTTSVLALALFAAPAFADMEAAQAFLDAEIGDLSTLTREEQEAEMQWFIDAAEPYQGMEINVVSETITTHEYESQVLAKAFEEITGIKVNHDLIGEGDVVEKLQTQMQSGENIYDAYVNDSDLIGTHWRYQQVRNLTDWMAGEGADVTSPTLDVDDFIGTSFTTGPDGKLYQLPTQQFANLYWFRYDWFNDEQNKADFQEKYGYELGVPVNWAAYEDIAEFFTGRDLSRLGVEGEVFGNMDYGKKDPSLGWRYTDAWMSMAGAGDVGEPNGLPVDEWGIRVNENNQPTGSCVARGGDTNGPAAVYAVTKAIEWLNKYSPPTAMGMTFGEAGPIPAQGNIAQQMFWYTAFTADMVNEAAAAVLNDDGSPRWRMAPSPHGVYWQEGTKVGYQDAGSWTLMESTPVDRAQAAWLYAQFVTSMTVDVEKSHAGLT
ncbi:MAG: ABC transporter substrate-binding protein, partial [Jannaschia helgolandensis]|uniref:ABC transporter substrate-binding protein n=1 Tax=Jannaschia helgolandensis TaxID=188906 RepID=UPI003C7298C0